MKTAIRILGVSLVLALILLGITNHEAKADFIVDPNPGENGIKLFNSADHKDVSTFDATISGNIVTVNTVGNVDSGAGFATITPVKDGAILTSVQFVPADETLFSDFSFRGQLLPVEGFTGIITLVVTDNNDQTFTFTIDKPNEDFTRIGIISLDGETISQVTITDEQGFKEVKQIEFSFAEGKGPVPEPISLILLGSGLAGAGLYRRFRRPKS